MLKNILKVCGVALLGCLIILLATAPFVFNQNNQVGQHKIVCADSVDYYFSTSKFPLNIGRFSANSVTSYVANSDYYSPFWFVLKNTGFECHFSYYSSVTYTFDKLFSNLSVNTWFDEVIVTSSFPYSAFRISYYISNLSFGVPVSFSVTSGTGYAGQSSLRCESLYFYDSDGNYIRFLIPYKPENFTVNLDYRSYNYSSDDNTYYLQGYSDGYSDGVSAGDSTGYQQGYNVGYGIGENVGYQQGITDASDYSFLALIGAVVDAPIQAFVNLLNFELLGFNMLSLCTGLLTLTLIIIVIRFVFVKR